MAGSRINFIGRAHEAGLLRAWHERLPHAQLTVIHGRRRVGKTRLITEAFGHERMLRFEGLEGSPTTVQQTTFLDQLAKNTGRKEYASVKPTNWTDLLDLLADYLESEATPESPIVVFFDEFQWTAAERADLVSRLKLAWETRLSELPIHLVLCGSVSSFLVNKVIRSKALYGRIHLEIHLQPLTVGEVASFLPKRSPREVVELYMALGGIPQYLEMVDPKRSTLLNLEELCFRPHGFLVGEFDRLLVSHFGKSPHYAKILATLTKKRIAGRAELAKACNLASGGSLTQYVEELELAGFIERYVPVGRPTDSKITRYRIADAYLLFYYQFIKPALKQIRAPGKPLPASRYLPERKLAPWRGISFERICRRHADVIAEKLGFSAVAYEAGSWFQRASSDPGAQIDLLFQRADRVATICEIKYHDAPIGIKVIKEVEKKLATYKNPKAQSVEPVLITASGITEDLAATGFFTRVLTIEDIFQEY